MASKKVCTHHEYFQRLAETTCPCGVKKTEVFSWGEYANGRWRTISYCCEACFTVRVVGLIEAHAGDCGCVFELRPRSGTGPLPGWIKLPETSLCAA